MGTSSGNQLTISIAGLPVTLELPDGDSAARRGLLEHYSAFLVEPRNDGLVVQVHIEPGPEYIPFVRARYWQIASREHNGRIEFKSHLEVGWVDRALNRGELTMRPQGNPENFLRVVYAWRCLEHDALLLHACGVIKDRRGYAFFGPSGSGKTTVANLSLDHQVLSDDMVIVKRRGSTFEVCGVPFRGDLALAPRTNKSAQLSGVFSLVKDVHHRIIPLRRTEAVARLSACVPFVMVQPANAQKVMDLCAELAGSVPVGALHFRPENRFWSLINGTD